MTTHVSTAPRHTHQCSECGRPFYLCSERDCDMAPDTCRACELDRQDDYMDRIEMGKPLPPMAETLAAMFHRLNSYDNIKKES